MSHLYLPMLIKLMDAINPPKMGEQSAKCNKILKFLLHGNPQKSSGLIPTVTVVLHQMLQQKRQFSAPYSQSVTKLG